MAQASTGVRGTDNINYLSPTGFRFLCSAMPETQFYCQTANFENVDIPIEESPFRYPYKQTSVSIN